MWCPRIKVVLVGLAVFGAFGCATGEDIFVGSRLENLCNEALPICGERAACVVAESEFVRGRFPGGQRVIVRTPTDTSTLRVRVFLAEQVFGGTEYLVRAADTGCNGFDESIQQDVDLFELAGDSQVLERDLEVAGRGDHLLELFSDMAAEYILTVTVIDR
ncbi:MAG: hypothetical protein AAF411_17960 [Myxococcota bacterium]